MFSSEEFLFAGLCAERCWPCDQHCLHGDLDDLGDLDNGLTLETRWLVMDDDDDDDDDEDDEDDDDDDDDDVKIHFMTLMT